MPGSSDLARGNVAYTFIIQTTLSPAQVNSTSYAEQTFTVNGLQLTDQISAVSKPTVQAGLLVLSGRVSAANTLAIYFGNPTGGNITPTAGEVYTIEVNRPSNSTLPTAIV